MLMQVTQRYSSLVVFFFLFAAEKERVL